MSDEIDYSEITRISKASLFFLGTFIRMEFALKEAGYKQKGSHRHDNVYVAQAAWDRYANSDELGESFFKAAINFAPTLINKPPRYNVIIDNTLDWEDAKPLLNAVELFTAVRRVRNNLVHGGKSQYPDEARNPTLIAESQAVIAESLKRQTTVRMIFERRY